MIDSNLQRFRQLAREASDSDEFYRQFVATFAQINDCDMGLAWCGDGVPYQPTCQFLLDPSSAGTHPLSSDQHDHLLSEVARRGKAMLATPPPSSPPGTPALLVGPLRFHTEQRLVEFILPGRQSRQDNQVSLNQLNDVCRTIEQMVSATASTVAPTVASVTSSEQIDKRELDEFAQSIHQSLDPYVTACNVANEARRVLSADRVSVFYRRGRKLRCEAISGQPSVNQRSNTVAALTKLVHTVAKTKRPFWFPSDDDIVPQIDQPLGDYIALSMTRSLAIVPITERLPETIHANLEEKINATPKPIACLVVEQVAQQWDRREKESAIDTVCRHSGEAIRNARQVEQIFLYPLWKAIGKTRVIMLGRNLPRTLIVAAALVALVSAMIFVQTDFQVTSDGTLEPAHRQRIFVDQDAVVRTVEVAHGDMVDRGDVLVTLENNELEIQIAQLTAEIDALQTRLKGSRSIRIGGKEDPQSVNQKEIESQINSLENRLKTVLNKKQRLRVTAPIQGEVLTWDLDSRLSDRPVRQGELLLEVADPDAAWRLELDLPDRKFGHLIEAAKTFGKELPVTFSLASAPGQSFTGHLSKIDEATSVNAERLHVVRLWIDVDESQLGDLKHAGSAATAKIDCGKRSLGFVWFHEIWEFVQYKVLFPVW